MTIQGDEWRAAWSFKNELGNKIDVSFQLKESADLCDVRLRIAGPTSEMTNNITVREAQEVYRGLGMLLLAEPEHRRRFRRQ